MNYLHIVYHYGSRLKCFQTARLVFNINNHLNTESTDIFFNRAQDNPDLLNLEPCIVERLDSVYID